MNAFSDVDFKYNLVFVGNGSCKEELIEYTIKKKVSAYFTNFVPPWVMPKLISLSDFFLSVECNFGVNLHSPGAFFEAMALEKVCILSDQLKNIPINEKTHIKINPLDIGDYTKKLIYSNSLSSEKYKEITNDAKKMFKNNFELGIVQRKNFFEEIVNDGYKKI